MNEAELKIEAIKQVLRKRQEIIMKQVIPKRRSPERTWYQGRVAGIGDALDLLSDSLECICVELE